MNKMKAVMDGLKIFVDSGEIYIGADSDIIYGGNLDTLLTEEQTVKLAELGWFRDELFDCWAIHI